MILTLTGTAVQLNFMVKIAFTTMRKEEERERERGGGERGRVRVVRGGKEMNVFLIKIF